MSSLSRNPLAFLYLFVVSWDVWKGSPSLEIPAAHKKACYHQHTCHLCQGHIACFCAFRTHLWIVQCTHLLPMVDSIPIYVYIVFCLQNSLYIIYNYTVYMIYIHIFVYCINVYVILHHVYVQIIYTLLRYIKGLYLYLHHVYIISMWHMYLLMYNHNRYKYINVHASSMSYEYIQIY